MPSWFQADNFRCETLADAIQLAPHIPSRIRSLNLFRDVPSIRTSVALEYKSGVVSLVKSEPRNSHQASEVETGKRFLVPVSIPHFPQRFSVVADDLPDIRAFGTVDGSMSVNAVIAEKLANAQQNYDLTEEYLQFGALQGIVKDADGSTLLNMYTLFGLTQPRIDIDLGATPDDIETFCNKMIRTVTINAGGIGVSSIHAFCGDSYFDALIKVPEVRAAYDRQADGEFLRQSHVYRQVFYKGITFENYRADYGFLADNTTGYDASNPSSTVKSIQGTNNATFFPVGAPIFRRYKGPANTLSSVGRVGRDIEITRKVFDHDEGVEYKLQKNMMHFCTHPMALVASTATYAA